MGTVHVSFGAMKDVRAKVAASRAGAHLVANNTRRPPNAFHFLRQVIILQRAGAGTAAQQFSAA